MITLSGKHFQNNFESNIRLSLCSGVGIPDPDAEYLHQKLRERKKEKRKKRLESQTSLRQQLNLS